MRRSFLATVAICALAGVVCVIGAIHFVPLAEATEVADEPSASADGSSTAAAATLPLRWRVAHAAELALLPGITDFCMTMVVVMNTTSSSVSAELEWFSAPGTLLVTESFTLTALQIQYVATDNQVLIGPFGMDVDSDLDDFTGFAQVYASDPRIIVSAYLICRDVLGDPANLTAMLPIPTFAVGESLEYFQAATPMMGGMPPVVVTKAPEER